MKYPIAEIFRSIQGEGHFAGTPCTFIRLAGCPLSCSFCDTDKTQKYYLEGVDILKKVIELDRDMVVLTGGEPTMYDLRSLVTTLHDSIRHVHLETNGWQRAPADVSWVSLSPKPGCIPNVGRPANEVKWLVPLWSLRDIQRLRGLGCEHFVQPVNSRTKLNKKSVQKCLEYIEKDPTLHLSIQLHKVIGVK